MRCTERLEDRNKQSQKKQSQMVSKQNMTQAMMQAAIEDTKGPIMAIRETEIPVNTKGQALILPIASGPVLKQPTINWKSPDKYL